MANKGTVNVDEEGEFLFKSIIIGDAGVGKSCILLRYTKQEFVNDYNVTIGVDFANKTVKIDKDTSVKLQIWDTAGQETFGAIIKKFFRNASIVFLVYDVNRRETFENMRNWLDNARSNCDENAILVLMGNQADQGDDIRQVSFQDGEAFMEQNNISFFFETSALNGDNIDKAFTEATKLAFLQYVKGKMGEAPPTNPGDKGMHLNKGSSSSGKKKEGCC